jgi:PAS domain S-box-containing protein
MPHGYSMNWQPTLIWLNVLSDAFIVLAYASISFLLLTVVRKRKDLSFNFVLLAFGAFILAGGATHFMAIVTLWKPWYWLEGIIKLFTAIASVTTAILLQRLLPVFLKMPRPLQLQQANEALALSNAELERRTSELATWYQSLETTIEAHRAVDGQFRQLANSMPHIVWSANPDGAVDYYNDRWYAFSGLDRSVFGDQSWLPLLHSDDAEQRRNAWYASVRSGLPFKEEYRFWDRASGAYRWHLGQALPITNDAGAVVKWYGACTDIDDYKRAEIQVRSLNAQLETRVAERTRELTQINSESRRTQTWLQALVQSATEISIMAIDNTGIITVFNSGTERLLGYQAEEVVGNCTADIFFRPNENEMRSRHISMESMVTVEASTGISLPLHQPSESYRSESVYLHRDGTPIDVSLAISPMIDSNGERLGKLAIAVDMRPQKALERQLTDNNVRLQVETRKAEEASRAKSDFLSAMSHEIRTPLNAILGMADLLWESELDDNQRRYVEVFRRACGSLLTLVNDILDLSKIESGRFELESFPFDLQNVVQLTLEMIRPKTKAKKVALKSVVAPNTPTTLVGDATRLQQILGNLLGNAAKFTEAGTITLSIEPSLDDPARLHFDVTDTGVGIAPDKLETIFQDFEQAESSTTRRFGGTGLGLGICRRLVKRMGGELRVRSELGKGSCFFFDAVFQASSREKNFATELTTGLSGRRVLIVDDNKTDRLIFGEIFRAWGMVTEELDNVNGALPALNSTAAGQMFDLIVIDRLINGENGIELIARIRETHPCVPILLITSDNVPGDQTRMASFAASEYAVKPVRRPDLLRLVCKLLGTQNAQDAGAGDPSPGLRQTHHKPRILIAEDSEDNRFLVEEYLKREPYEIKFVENGKLAVEAAAEQTFDLILMDMQMPVMDGVTATKLIREAEKQKDSPAVSLLALTANAGREDIECSKTAGCDAHVSKPISKEELLRMIRQYVGGGAVKKDAPPAAVDLPAPASPSATTEPLAVNIPRGMEEAAKRYIRSRRKEVPQMLDFFQSNNFKQIQVLAHNMKGTGTPYGFPDLTRLGRSIETAARDNNAVRLSEQLNELSAYVQEAEKLIFSSK